MEIKAMNRLFACKQEKKKSGALRKFKSRKGESLVETLLAVLVVALAMTMLAGSIVSAARVNNKAENLSTAFNADSSNISVVSGIQTATIDHSAKITMGSNIGETVADDLIGITFYQTNDHNGYQFYSKTP